MKFTSFKLVSTLVLLAALVACGGGSALGDPEVLMQPHPVASNAGPMDTVAVPTRRMAASVHALDASSFLNWAESAYPALFEAPQSNKTIDVWTYRYYPKTDIYLGTNTSGDVLGLVGKGAGEYNSYPLGKITDYGCSVYPSDCTKVNTAPVANAGAAQNVVAGSVVTLDGSASSDANSDPLTYAWILTAKPAGSSAALSSSISAKPTFTADVAGTYVGTLTVNDGKVSSAAVTMSVTASVANAAPVEANAPTTPTGLTVTARTSNSVTLTWNASTGGAGGVYSYQLYRNGYAIGGMGYNASTSLTYTDVNLTPGMVHSYSIEATAVSGAKSQSSTAVETTTLSLSLLKAKLIPFIVFETATGKIRGQAFASPGVIAAAAPLPGFSVVNHTALDTAIYGIKSIGAGQYAIYRYSTGEVVEQPLAEMVLNGASNANASYVLINLNSGQIDGNGGVQTLTLFLNIASNANGGGGYLDKEIL